VRTQILRGPRQWTAVRHVWEALLEAGPEPYYAQLPEWMEAVSNHLHDDDSRWFVAEDDEGPLVALPYQTSVRRQGPLRVRMLANERGVDGLAAPRLRPDPLRRALLAASAADGEPIDVLSLNGLRPGSAFIRLATAASTGLYAEVRHGGFSTIETRVTADEWMAAASRNLRSGLRKARNRFEARGTMTISEVTTPAEVEAAFEEYVAIEATGWKADSGALANQPVDRALMRHLLVACAATGQATVRMLRLDGRAVAGQLATIGAGTLVLYKVAYDEAHADLSPSNILLADLIKACCDRPDVDRIDLVTKQPWHERWQAVAQPTYRTRDLNVRRPGGLVSRVGALLEDAGVRLPTP